MSRVCDIEFGHRELEPNDWALELDEVARSAEIATMLIDQLESHGVAVSTSILIDDKRSRARSVDVMQYVDGLRRIAGEVRVDKLLLESSLAAYVDDLVSVVDERRRDQVSKEIKDYALRAGSIGCSHDIALWHSLRLGLIDVQPLWLGIPGVPIVWNHAYVCVSVLPERYKTFEKRARERILDHIPGFEAGRLHVIYFDLDRIDSAIASKIDATADTIANQIHDSPDLGPYLS